MQIEVLGERYQLQESIGRGGMATIYRGRDTHMERVVAIKVLREVYSTDPKFVTRFQREAKAASSLQHPNIVQVYDYGQSDGNYYIVMELVEGTDLRRYLRSRGILAIDRAIIIAHDIALGLGAAHRRSIVHRDVKPQNILVGRDGSIKLTDFGIASVYKDINAERLTTTGMTLGTVQYYAPEQAQGEIVSPAADVYALGIVMYEMLAGRTPFDGDTPVAVAMQHIQDVPIPPSQYNPGIPPALEEIILRCLEKVPEMRFRDGSALARALELLGEEEIGDGLPSTITTDGATTPPTTVGPPYNQTWSNNGTRADGRGATPRSASSPNNFTPPDPYSTSTVQENGMGGRQRPAPAPAFEQQQEFHDQLPIQLDSSSTRPFDRGTLSHSGVADQRESSFASIVTVLILLATLLLLGFAIFLAGELNLINIPGLKPALTPTPAATSQVVTVPDLHGKSFDQAQAIAQGLGFKVRRSPDSAQTGVVMSQSPAAGYRADPKTSVIEVKLATPTPTVTITVPDVVGLTVTNAEKILTDKHIHYSLIQDPTGAPGVVTSTDPAAGNPVPSETTVKLYVNQNAPTPLPAPSPTPSPVPSPTPSPAPSPTPSPTPSPAPSPTPSPTPKHP